MSEVQKHRNGVSSIEVEFTSIKDPETGEETNLYYNMKPTYIDADGNEQPVRKTLVEGEALRLIQQRRAKPVRAKKTRAPSNKQAATPKNK